MFNKVLVNGFIKKFHIEQGSVKFIITNKRIANNQIREEEILCIGYSKIAETFSHLQIGDYVMIDGYLRNNKTSMEVMIYNIELLKKLA